MTTTSLTEAPVRSPHSVGDSGGGASEGGFAVLEPDPWPRQDMRWCVNCGGPTLFVRVDRFPCGWRGYCLGCEEVKYVMDERTNSEAA